MLLVPVIDLKEDRVVHARGGHRDAYRPIQSRLCPVCDPVEVVNGFLQLFDFSTVYVADLDAIEHKGSNAQAIGRLSRAFPDVEFWVDCGLSSVEEISKWLVREPGRAVLGSECLSSLAPLADLMRHPLTHRIILSLDFRADVLLGPSELLERPDLWPDDVIIMALTRVGTDTGPNFKQLAAVREQAEDKRLFAAGGVRHERDLQRLGALGISGALVASALHDGRIDRSAILRLIQP